jgi:quinol---cytochrome-c reductase cytochrome c subunit
MSPTRRRAGSFHLVPLAVATVVGVVGWFGQPGVARHLAASAADARELYLRDCAVCHGPDGLGTSEGPTLKGWGRAGVDYTLTTGRMPLSSPDAEPVRQTPKYDLATISALEDYIATLVPGGPDIPHVDVATGDLAAGGVAFRDQCAACHQWAGGGGAPLQREAPPLGPATATQIAEAVRTGPGAMPLFGSAALTDAELAGVARYVEYLDSPEDPGGQPLWHLGPVAEGAVGLLALAALLGVIRLIGSRP